jgi:hypothetical protein
MINRHMAKVGKGALKHIYLAMVEIFVKDHGSPIHHIYTPI